MQRFLLPIGILVIALAATWWLWTTAQPSPPPPPPVGSPSPAATATAPGDALEREQRQYRLAGVAVGEPSSFAAIELPDGASNLYRQGDQVPGLGRIAEIHPDHILVTTATDHVILHLKSAPSPTADPRKLGRAPRRTEIKPKPAPEPTEPDDAADESDSGDDLDQPAS